MTSTLMLSQAVMWPFAFKYIDLKGICAAEIEKHVRQILILFLPVMGISIYAGIDKVMIGNMVGNKEVAIYAYAENLSKLPIGIVTALTTVMLPHVSKLMAEKKVEASQRMIHRTMQTTMLLALPIALGIAAIADKMVPWFYAADFLPCIPLIKMLIVIIIFIAWTYVVQNQCLIPMRKDTVLVKSALLTAVLNVSANLILIPLWGITGAAIGTILSECMVMCYKTYHCREYIRIGLLIRDNLWIVVAALIMHWCVYWTGERIGIASPKTTVIQILVGIAVYACLCIPMMMRKKHGS